MTAHSATEFVASRFKERGFKRTWSPDMEARLGAMMLRDATAAGHRKGFPAPPPKQARRKQVTPAGEVARRMAAEGADGHAIAAATGLSLTHCQKIVHRVRGRDSTRLASTTKPPPHGIKAREMIAEGHGWRAVVEATGLHKTTVQKLIRRRAQEAAA